MGISASSHNVKFEYSGETQCRQETIFTAFLTFISAAMLNPVVSQRMFYSFCFVYSNENVHLGVLREHTSSLFLLCGPGPCVRVHVSQINQTNQLCTRRRILLVKQQKQTWNSEKLSRVRHPRHRHRQGRTSRYAGRNKTL